jgi:cytidylate kinase
MSIITISRGSLSGGRALAERLADRLGYRCISSEALIEAASKYGVSEPKLSEVFDKTPSFWERLTKSRRLYLIFIQAAMGELAQRGKLIYHGQGGQQLLKGISHVMKVRLIAPTEYRLRAAMERQGLTSREAAMQYLQQVDEERLRRMRYLFNVDWRDPALYDVVLNIEHMSLETAADVVIYMAQHPEYQPTAASEKQLNDLTLSCRIRALLAANPTTSGIEVEVRTDDGIVWITGLIDSGELEYAILHIVQTVPGVTGDF